MFQFYRQNTNAGKSSDLLCMQNVRRNASGMSSCSLLIWSSMSAFSSCCSSRSRRSSASCCRRSCTWEEPIWSWWSKGWRPRKQWISEGNIGESQKKRRCAEKHQKETQLSTKNKSCRKIKSAKKKCGQTSGAVWASCSSALLPSASLIWETGFEVLFATF